VELAAKNKLGQRIYANGTADIFFNILLTKVTFFKFGKNFLLVLLLA